MPQLTIITFACISAVTGLAAYAALNLVLKRIAAIDSKLWDTLRNPSAVECLCSMPSAGGVASPANSHSEPLRQWVHQGMYVSADSRIGQAASRYVLLARAFLVSMVPTTGLMMYHAVVR